MINFFQLTELSPDDFPEFYQFYQFSPERYPFFLSSTSQSAPVGVDIHHSDSNFDILFIEPEQWLMLDNDNVLSGSAELDILPEDGFLDSFNKLYQDCAINIEDRDIEDTQNLPFYGGWFVFLSYELAQEVEPVLKQHIMDSGCKEPQEELQGQPLPQAYAARVRQAVIIDHKKQQVFFVTENDVDHQQALKILQNDISDIQQSTLQKPDLKRLLQTLNEENKQRFLDAVDRVRQYIRDGDVFQVNMSRLWQAEIDYSQHANLAASLFQKLSKSNPAPFSGLASFNNGNNGQATIISSSPERLLSIRNNRLESRPIAGTHPRSQSDDEDQRLIERLHKHPKEQAEHIMLIDLIRNDLGRVCVPGSVKVDELMVNESYAHVHHIVSNVVGELEQYKTPVDAIRALFPGGTITGCPKVRCMEIIAELEQCSRGAYTGSMGYINRDGSMDLNILIRTMVLEQQHNTQHLSFRAGAGLVFDSIAERELKETRAKAKGLLKALGSEQSESRISEQ